MKNMLGNNEALRRVWSGPLLTFLERLNGENGEQWETEFNEFLRKGDTWIKKNMPFGSLDVLKPVPKGKSLSGTDFVSESRKLAEKDGKQTLGQEAYDFYKRKENWHLLPGSDSGIDVVVFCDAQFGSGGYRYVRYLCRDGADWSESDGWLSGRFDDDCGAAVSQVSPQD